MTCARIQIPGGGVAILCRGRERRRRCQTPSCWRWGVVLCDHLVGKGKKTCNAWMCERHRRNVGPDRDLCPLHAGQRELFEEGRS